MFVLQCLNPFGVHFWLLLEDLVEPMYISDTNARLRLSKSYVSLCGLMNSPDVVFQCACTYMCVCVLGGGGGGGEGGARVYIMCAYVWIGGHDLQR